MTTITKTMQPDTENSEYITIDEAAQLLGCARTQVYPLIKICNLQVYKQPFKHRTYLRKNELLEAISGFYPKEQLKYPYGEKQDHE